MNFMGATAKLTIGSLDDTELEVRAQYNPKELQLDKQVPWQETKGRDNRSTAKRLREGGQDDAEINTTPSRCMTVELLFDGYEEKRSVQPEIDQLEELSSIRNPDMKSAEYRRPHHCVVAWGAKGMRPFRCVIESLSTKLTMFDDDGTPLRAVCTVKLREVIVMESGSSEENFMFLARARGWSSPEHARTRSPHRPKRLP